MVFSVPLGLNSSFGHVPMQGMRVHDTTNGQLAVSAAVCSGPYDNDWNAVLAVDDRTGNVVAKRYPRWRHWEPPVRDDTLSSWRLYPGLRHAGCWAWSRSHWQATEGARADGELVGQNVCRPQPSLLEPRVLRCGRDSRRRLLRPCGNGGDDPEGRTLGLPPEDVDRLRYRADHLGKQKANVTDAAEQCINDAGSTSSLGRTAATPCMSTRARWGKGDRRNFGLVVSAPGPAEAGKPTFS